MSQWLALTEEKRQWAGAHVESIVQRYIQAVQNDLIRSLTGSL